MSCGLSKVPPSLFQCVKLNALDLGKNELSELSEDVKFLTNLQSLVLKKNNISVLPQTLPSCINLL